MPKTTSNTPTIIIAFMQSPISRSRVEADMQRCWFFGRGDLRDCSGGLTLFGLIVTALEVFALRRLVVFEYPFSQVFDEILIVRIILRMSFVSNHRLLLHFWE